MRSTRHVNFDRPVVASPDWRYIALKRRPIEVLQSFIEVVLQGCPEHRRSGVGDHSRDTTNFRNCSAVTPRTIITIWKTKT